MKTYYKVIVQEYDTLLSARIREKGWKLTYSIGRWTTPINPQSRIFVFDSIEAATNSQWVDKYTDLLFECEVKNPVKVKFAPKYHENAMRWWSLPSLNRKREFRKLLLTTVMFQTSTYTVKAVKLLRQVEWPSE